MISAMSPVFFPVFPLLPCSLSPVFPLCVVLCVYLWAELFPPALAAGTPAHHQFISVSCISIPAFLPLFARSLRQLPW